MVDIKKQRRTWVSSAGMRRSLTGSECKSNADLGKNAIGVSYREAKRKVLGRKNVETGLPGDNGNTLLYSAKRRYLRVEIGKLVVERMDVEVGPKGLFGKPHAVSAADERPHLPIGDQVHIRKPRQHRVELGALVSGGGREYRSGHIDRSWLPRWVQVPKPILNDYRSVRCIGELHPGESDAKRESVAGID